MARVSFGTTHNVGGVNIPETADASHSRGLTVADVEAAAARIAGKARRTPTLSFASLDQLSNAQVYLKPENFQRTGSFKFRGAVNRVLQLSPSEREAGIVAFSSGNHGAAVSLAASMVGASATVVVPADGSKFKLDAIANYGGVLHFYDRSTEEPAAVARSIVESTGGVLVPPFDDYDVMAGQGTLALELFEDVADLDVVVVPIGGGGLIAGVGTVAKARRCRVVGVEPAGAADTHLSLRSGRRQPAGTPRSIADGLLTAIPGELTFPINKANLDEIVLVSEDDIIDAVRFCFERMKLVVEPSGAVGLAAVLSGAIGAGGSRIGVVVTGGNVSLSRLSELIGERSPVESGEPRAGT